MRINKPRDISGQGLHGQNSQIVIVYRCEYWSSEFVMSLLVMLIIINFTGYHEVLLISMLIFLLPRLLRICSPRLDLRDHVTDGKTQFLPSVSSYWIVGLSANYLLTK